jgi:hypothetical protein
MHINKAEIAKCTWEENRVYHDYVKIVAISEIHKKSVSDF